MDSLICLVRPLLMGLKAIFKKVDCGKIEAVVAPRFSGKSHLVSQAIGKKYKLLDLEENIKLHLTADEKQMLSSFESSNASYNLHYYPLVKKYLIELRKNWKHQNLLIFSSDYELLKYCGMSDSQINVFIPSNSLATAITSNLNEHDQRLFDSSRTELMLKGSDKVVSYSSFDDMNKLIIAKWKLQNKL